MRRHAHLDLALKRFWDLDPRPLLRHGLHPNRDVVVRPVATEIVHAVRRDADRVVHVLDPAPEHLAHVEFEARAERSVGARVLGYNIGTWERHDRRLPVDSLVVCLRRPRVIPTGRHDIVGPAGLIHTFRYRVLHLWRTPADTLASSDLAPLCPLGAELTPSALRLAAASVQQHEDDATVDRLALLYLLALYSGVTPRDLRVILDLRRLEMSPLFAELIAELTPYTHARGVEEGIQIGRAQAREEALEEGRREGAIAVALRLLELRDPALRRDAEPLVRGATEADALWLTELLVGAPDASSLRAQVLSRLGG
jgi:hypothetical protein